ncbi:GIY-YIG nuclease family protein [Aminobacterium sp. MB27-C1]|uniref:GIY-YIG nuclease family protein n=1 Tax=Aminobacterium sp. MB27-C1 TaxID=3070661 RepID=UPI0035A725B2
MKSGYLYVLVHPSDSDLYKIGQTACYPEERLAEHNCNDETYTGQVVKETVRNRILKRTLPFLIHIEPKRFLG